MKKILLGAAAALVMGISGAANAEIVRLPSMNIQEYFINDGSVFGGCMVKVPVDVTQHGCRSGYLTFSCNGELQDADAANRMFEVAQISFLTNRSVLLEIDTNRQHNRYCMVTRAQLQN